MTPANPLTIDSTQIQQLVELSANHGLSLVQAIIFIVSVLALVSILIGLFMWVQKKTFNALLDQQVKDAEARDRHERELVTENRDLMNRVMALTESGIAASSATTNALSETSRTLADIRATLAEDMSQFRVGMAQLLTMIDERTQATDDKVEMLTTTVTGLKESIDTMRGQNTGAQFTEKPQPEEVT